MNKKTLLKNCENPKGLAGRRNIRRMNEHHGPLSEWGLGILGDRAVGRALDIGCGGGTNLVRLLSGSVSYAVGVDHSALAVTSSRKTLSRSGLKKRGEVLKADVANLPFPDGYFDTVTAFETVYFWNDVKRAFGEVFRVLAEGGTFTVCNESAYTESCISDAELPFGINVYTEKQLSNMMTDAGFTGIRAYTKDGWVCVIAEKAVVTKE